MEGAEGKVRRENEKCKEERRKRLCEGEEIHGKNRRRKRETEKKRERSKGGEDMKGKEN